MPILLTEDEGWAKVELGPITAEGEGLSARADGKGPPIAT